MSVNTPQYESILHELTPAGVTLVAVSKTKPVADIQELYELGQRDFGENYVQELVEKAPQLPADIRWHFIGHLQSNKVKLILPVVQLIEGVDSLKLLKEISKQAVKLGKTADVLLQMHVAQEETKFGMDAEELAEAMKLWTSGDCPQVQVKGLMGMASFTDDKEKVRTEFRLLKKYFDQYAAQFSAPAVLSMGMSGDYGLAIAEGSTLVRIGSLIFGARS